MPSSPLLKAAAVLAGVGWLLLFSLRTHLVMLCFTLAGYMVYRHCAGCVERNGLVHYTPATVRRWLEQNSVLDLCRAPWSSGNYTLLLSLCMFDLTPEQQQQVLAQIEPKMRSALLARRAIDAMPASWRRRYYPSGQQGEGAQESVAAEVDRAAQWVRSHQQSHGKKTGWYRALPAQIALKSLGAIRRLVAEQSQPRAQSEPECKPCLQQELTCTCDDHHHTVDETELECTCDEHGHCCEGADSGAPTGAVDGQNTLSKRVQHDSPSSSTTGTLLPPLPALSPESKSEASHRRQFAKQFMQKQLTAHAQKHIKNLRNRAATMVLGTRGAPFIPRTSHGWATVAGVGGILMAVQFFISYKHRRGGARWIRRWFSWLVYLAASASTSGLVLTNFYNPKYTSRLIGREDGTDGVDGRPLSRRARLYALFEKLPRLHKCAASLAIVAFWAWYVYHPMRSARAWSTLASQWQQRVSR